MFTELFKIVYKNAQTLGKEDVLTALLASMFELSPSLCIYFLKHSYISCPENIINQIISEHYIKTGITYYNEFDNLELNYKFRPDLLIASSNNFAEKAHHHILIESKIFANLTHNQYKGYPDIKNVNKDSIYLILITNYQDNSQNTYFDKIISWKQLYEIVNNYIVHKSGPIEKCLLGELLDSFNVIGVELNEFIFTNWKRNEVVDGFIDIPTFVKVMRRNLGMTQEQFAEEIGVGLRFIRELEQGNKNTLRSDKINIVLSRFNCTLAPVVIK